ncbi:MAG TPA: DCC1-like thiol-disulfide oxidoreductase family protein [Solirubrobacterales bacterium]|nr:DCC1-like thiol-disulfide oxidoreductase family protein [Solirubrobacterales bacterium]
MGPKATVIYDADCGFCRVSLALLLSWGRQRALRPLPLGSPEANLLLADLTEAERDASWHLVLDDGTRFSAGAAVAPALSLLPGGHIPAALFARFPGATERTYRRVAAHRGLLGRFVPARARRWADRVIARTPYP